ncbi:hypothetical protein RhiJN_07352 [Ceratobasidium sp. AG-Ba]|nr:hypothetical protein RhiJN_07352 [Ceratobasidium sp. AG-Ba]
MSNGGSDFVHLSATPSVAHDASSSNQSDLSGLSNDKHVRMGRGLVKVRRYESEAGRGSKRSPTSPISPVSTDDNEILGPSQKRRWFQVPLRRRNISVGGIPTDKYVSSSAKRGEIKSWVDMQARERWDSQERPEVRPATFDIRREPVDQERSLTPTPSRSDLSIDPRYNAASPSSLTGNSYDTPASSRGMSPLRAPLPRSPEDEDEDGRALLEALGLGDPHSLAEQTETPEDTHVQDISDCESEAGEHPVPQLSYVLPQIRPLPAIPLLPTTSSLEFQAQSNSQLNIAPPLHDSQDAYAYVFGSSPRSSAQYRESMCPPPPYVSRYSAMLNRPTISRQDMEALQQRLRGMEIPEVAPLAIRKRDDKLSRSTGV